MTTPQRKPKKPKFEYLKMALSYFMRFEISEIVKIKEGWAWSSNDFNIEGFVIKIDENDDEWSIICDNVVEAQIENTLMSVLIAGEKNDIFEYYKIVKKTDSFYWKFSSQILFSFLESSLQERILYGNFDVKKKPKIVNMDRLETVLLGEDEYYKSNKQELILTVSGEKFLNSLN